MFFLSGLPRLFRYLRHLCIKANYSILKVFILHMANVRQKKKGSPKLSCVLWRFLKELQQIGLKKLAINNTKANTIFVNL